VDSALSLLEGVIRIRHLGLPEHFDCDTSFLILAQILLSASVTFASDIRPSCELAKESILSRSSKGRGDEERFFRFVQNDRGEEIFFRR
jgi:hypothetical protein